MAPPKPSLVFNKKWMLPLLILGVIMTPLSFVLLAINAMGPIFSGFISVWGGALALLIFVLANRAAIQLAFDENRIDEDDHQHWIVRTGIGIKLCSVIFSGMTCFFVFSLITQKTTLTLVTDSDFESNQVKNYLHDQSLKVIRKDSSNGKKVLTFHTNKTSSTGFLWMHEQKKGEYPEYSANNIKLKPDYSKKYSVAAKKIEDTLKCYYTIDLISPPQSNHPIKVKSNLNIGTDKIYLIDNKIFFESNNFLKLGPDERCRTYHISDYKIKEQEYDFKAMVLYPHITFKSESPNETKRLTIRTWKELNDFYDG